MEIPATITIEIAHERAALYEPEVKPSVRKHYVRLGMDDYASPRVVTSLEALFNDWFKRTSEGTRSEDWKAGQFAMERLLEAQLQAVRQRLLQKGVYPSQ